MSPALAPSTPDASPSAGTAARGHLPVLDILRAAAVVIVIAYHAFPRALPSGYLGVDLFFVLSGYLITRGLISRVSARRLAADPQQRQPTAGFLRDFYLKRLRRLFPAFAFMLVTVCSLALLAPPDTRVHLGRQVIGALTSTANWIQLATGSGYFAADTPQLLKHMWSLAVEEQFYLVWPAVILLVAFRLRTHPRAAAVLRVRLALITLTGAGLSALAMAVVFAVTGSPDQAYLNSLTHASGLMLGAYVACMPQRPASGPAARRATAAAALAVVALSLVLLPEDSPLPQLGGIFVFSLAAAVLVRLGTTGPAAQLPGTSGPMRPFQWLASRSYALYLWHWPLLVLTAAWLPDRNGGQIEPALAWGRAGLALIPALLLAEISFRWIERPVLHHGFRGALAAVGRPRWKRPLLVGAALALSTTTAVAAVTAPAQTEQQQMLEELQAASPASSDDERSSPSPSATPSPGPQETDDDAAASPSATPTPSSSASAKEGAAVDSEEVAFVGDSVTVAASPTITQRFPDSSVEAEVGLQMWDAADRVRTMSAEGRLGRTVVVALGANGTFSDEDLHDVVEAAGPGHRFVLVTGYGDKPWIEDANHRLRDYATAHSQDTRLAEWDRVAPQATDMAPDGVHPGTQGAGLWMDEVTRAIRSFED